MQRVSYSPQNRPYSDRELKKLSNVGIRVNDSDGDSVSDDAENKRVAMELVVQKGAGSKITKTDYTGADSRKPAAGKKISHE